MLLQPMRVWSTQSVTEKDETSEESVTGGLIRIWLDSREGWGQGDGSCRQHGMRRGARTLQQCMDDTVNIITCRLSLPVFRKCGTCMAGAVCVACPGCDLCMYAHKKAVRVDSRSASCRWWGCCRTCAPCQREAPEKSPRAPPGTGRELL